MIVKGRVDLRIEHFQQCRRWVASEIHRHLINFIKEKKWIPDACFGEFLNDFSRHGPYVGSSMSSNLCFVTNTTEGHSYEFSARCSSDACSQGCFTYSRWSNQAQYRPFEFFGSRLNCQILCDPFFNSFQAIMVFI